MRCNLRHVLLAAGFALLVSAAAAQEEIPTFTAKFKVKDYDPTLQAFVFKPDRKSRVLVVPVSEDGPFPSTLLKVGKTVVCEVSQKFLGIFRARDGEEVAVIRTYLVCNGTRFRAASLMLLSEEEYREQTRKLRQRVTGRP